jgi:hypothetical protein
VETELPEAVRRETSHGEIPSDAGPDDRSPGGLDSAWRCLSSLDVGCSCSRGQRNTNRLRHGDTSLIDTAVGASRFPGNEFVARPVRPRHFNCNPVRLDGHPLDWGSFSLKTTGKLTLVHGDRHSPQATPIPFTVSLRRNGELLSRRGSVLSRQLESVDLADVLALSRPGDQLIIDPVNARDWLAKRIVALGGC